MPRADQVFAKFRAVDRHPQKKLLGALRAALGEPLADANAAAAPVRLRQDERR